MGGCQGVFGEASLKREEKERGGGGGLGGDDISYQKNPRCVEESGCIG